MPSDLGKNSADPAPPTRGPLTPEHLRELADARRRFRRVSRAAAIASFSGWSMAVFAGLTLLVAFLSDWTAWMCGAGLALIAWNEIRGGVMLKRLEPRGARVLGWNQIALGVLLVAYGVWSLAISLKQPALASIGSTGDPNIDAMAESLNRTLSYGLYGSLVVIGILVPGLTSLYYFTRGPMVRKATESTAPWILELWRSGGG